MRRCSESRQDPATGKDARDSDKAHEHSLAESWRSKWNIRPKSPFESRHREAREKQHDPDHDQGYCSAHFRLLSRILAGGSAGRTTQWPETCVDSHSTMELMPKLRRRVGERVYFLLGLRHSSYIALNKP